MRLQDRVVVVTGSAAGIGKEVARACLGEGARVLLHGLEADEEGAKVMAELDPEGERVSYLRQDLAEVEAPGRIVGRALEVFGRLDALVNNAAWVWFSRIPGLGREDYEKMMRINLSAPLFLIQEALPHLAERGGSVVNIGSVNAHCGEPGLLPYSISKGGLMTLTRNLGDTLHREYGVRVNQINPGWVLTENEKQRKIAQGMPEDWPSRLPQGTGTSGRLLRPEEIAAGVLFFLVEDSGPVSGCVLDMEQYPMIGRNFPKE